MSNLTVYQTGQDELLEVVIDTKTGETFASQSAVARMCGVTQPTISKFCSHSKMELETSEVYVPSSVASHSNKTVKRKVKLLNEDQILDCLYEYNPKLTRAFAQLGLRKYHHEITGYKHKQNKALYPDRSQEYTDLYQELKDIIKASGGKKHYYIQLNQALNKVVGKVKGRTGNPISEFENLAYCKLMSRAIDSAKLALNSNHKSKTYLFAIKQIQALQPQITAIQTAVKTL